MTNSAPSILCHSLADKLAFLVLECLESLQIPKYRYVQQSISFTQRVRVDTDEGSIDRWRRKRPEGSGEKTQHNIGHADRSKRNVDEASESEPYWAT